MKKRYAGLVGAISLALLTNCAGGYSEPERKVLLKLDKEILKYEEKAVCDSDEKRGKDIGQGTFYTLTGGLATLFCTTIYPCAEIGGTIGGVSIIGGIIKLNNTQNRSAKCDQVRYIIKEKSK